jgi:hypothetical protein
MKNYLPILALACAGILFLSSCNQEEQYGNLKFGLDLGQQASLKSSMDDRELVGALVSIRDANGMMVVEKEYLELISFGGQYVTRSLELRAGEYFLSEFMLLGPDGEVLWATPKEGSNLAHLVDQPLPVFFGIHPDETTGLDIQVVRVDRYTPGDFGYAQFQIDFVDRFCLKVFLNAAFLDTGNDTTPGWYPPGVPVYQPRIIILAGDRLVLDRALDPGINFLNLPILDAYYHVSAYGYHQEELYSAKFGLDELLQYGCGPEYPSLYIEAGGEPGIVITPEGLKEPDILQGIFGQLTRPTLDPDETGQYDVEPVVRDIYFFHHDALDSLYTAAGELVAPVDCYYPADLIWQQPAAIVRPNSEGYFQVSLEVGEYMYMVRTAWGYYVDAYISSRLPGLVVVHPEEVTELSIHLIDCSLWQ